MLGIDETGKLLRRVDVAHERGTAVAQVLVDGNGVEWNPVFVGDMLVSFVACFSIRDLKTDVPSASRRRQFTISVPGLHLWLRQRSTSPPLCLLRRLYTTEITKPWRRSR